MKFRSTMIALLVSGACVAASVPAMANDRNGYDRNDGYSSGSSFRINIDLGRHPRWNRVRGTRVYQINGPRDYDAFRYGGNYYVRDNDRWYRSHRTRGEFVQIDDRAVPREFQQMNRGHWQQQNTGWQDRNDQRGRNRHSWSG